MEGKVNIKVKHMSEKPVDLELTQNMTVKEVKEKLSPHINVPAGEQKLICKGKILKDDDRVSDVMEEGCTIHAIKNRAVTGNISATTGGGFGLGAQAGGNTNAGGAQQNASDPFAAFGGAGGAGMGGMGGLGGLGGLAGMGGAGGMDPAMMQQALGNPQVQRMMQDMFSNPDQLRQMIDGNPMLSQMVNNNPQMRSMFDNPEMLRTMGQMMSNPNMMANLGGMGGLGGLSGMSGFGGTAFGQPQPQAGVEAGVGTGAQAGGNPAGAGFGGAGAGGMDLNSLLQGLNAGGQGGAGAGFGGAGAGGMDLNSLLQGLNAGGQGGAGAGAGFNLANFMPPQQQTNPNLAPEERYREQLEQMSDMGFTNKDLNIQMLDATGGNVQLAIERLLSMLG